MMQGNSPFHQRLRSERPLKRYMRSRLGSSAYGDREADMDIHYADHFWGFSTSYDAENTTGDYATLDPFIDEITVIGESNTVYDVDITLGACKNGIHHQAWVLYGEDHPVNDRDGTDAEDGPTTDLFDTEELEGIVDGFDMDIFGYYVNYSNQSEPDETPMDRIFASVEALADEHQIYDVQFNYTPASSGHYHEAWVLYDER